MKKRVMLILSCLFLSLGLVVAQTTRINGTVVDSNGEPVISASVVVKGTTVGTVTDLDGKFSINVPDGNNTLVFTLVGMKTIEAKAASNMNVVMQNDDRLLDEVVVTAIGIKRAEKSLAYTVSQVNSDELTKTGDKNVLGALSGKVAGLKISSSSGAPGASSRVVVRGFTSLTGSNEPLFVVDGVPLANNRMGSSTSYLDNNADYGNAINDINPNDIESVSVLKGASATTLYGSRAANGVIMITTKKGSAQDKVKIDFTSNTTLSRVGMLPTFQNRYGQGWGYQFSTLENGSWGPRLDGKDRLWGNIVDNEQLYKPYAAQKNNLRDFYDTGVQYDNSLAISGGQNKVTYYLSYSNVYSDGVIPTAADTYKRNSVALKGSYTDKWLTTSANVNYIRKSVNTPSSGQGYSVFNNLIQIPRDFSIVDMEDYHNKFYSIDNWYTPYSIINPYFSLNEDGNHAYEDRTYGDLNVSAKLTDFLTLSWRGGGDYTSYKTQSWRAIMIPNGTNTTDKKETGYVQEISGDRTEYNSDLVLTFNKNIGDDFNLSALAGHNINERRAKQQSISVQGLDLPNFYHISNSANTPTTTVVNSTRRLVGIYAQADLAYKNFLYLTIGGRNDWSSTLPKDNRSFFYPTAGLSFLFSDIIEPIKSVVNYGKVRIAYGQTGNDAPPYRVNSSLTRGNVTNPFGEGLKYPFNGVNAYTYYDIVGNQALQPEISKELELGFEIRMFNNRANLDVTFYNKETTDQIMEVPLPPSSGYGYQYMNLGKIRNRGVELSINLIPVQIKDFQWDLGFNWALNRSKLVELNDDIAEYSIYGFTNGISLIATPGSPLGMFVGYGTMKDDKGNTVVNPANGLPYKSTERQTFGSSEQKYTMGIRNEFAYKDFSLGFSFDFRIGGLMYSRTKGTTLFVGNSPQTLFNDRQPFIVPGSVVKNSDGTYSENTKPINYVYYDSYWNDNGGMFDEGDLISKTSIRMQDLHFSYTVPSKLIKNTFIKKLNLSLIGQNLWIWTPKSNNFIDPMVSNMGTNIQSEFGEFSTTPSIRSFGFSLKATF